MSFRLVGGLRLRGDGRPGSTTSENSMDLPVEKSACYRWRTTRIGESEPFTLEPTLGFEPTT